MLVLLGGIAVPLDKNKEQNKVKERQQVLYSKSMFFVRTEDVGRRAISALENVYGTKYRFGTGADILCEIPLFLRVSDPSSGGSDDWAKGKGGAKYVYLMELRPGEEVWDGFILDSRQLIPTGRETWAGIKVVIEAVLNLKRAKHASTIEASAHTAATTQTTTTSTLPPTTQASTTPRPRPISRTPPSPPRAPFTMPTIHSWITRHPPFVAPPTTPTTPPKGRNRTTVPLFAATKAP
ncbi:unnamed protein product, partial [Cylicostephanus goldi]